MAPALTARRIVLLLGAYYLLWWLVNLPATSQPWWTADDYAHAVNWHWRHNFEQGRPLSNLVTYTLTWETGAAGAALNVGLRATQGFIHAGVAVLVAFLLYARTQARSALVAPLIFLLWPPSQEAVLWRAAAAIPLAALLSVTGALLVQAGAERRRWLLSAGGALLVIVAVLLQQLGAGAGLLVWAMALVVQSRPANGRDVAGALWLGAGYVVGALASMRIARVSLGSLPGRDQLATDWRPKLGYLVDLWESVIQTPYNPLQARGQVVLFILLIVVVLVGLVLVKEPAWAKGVRVTAFVALFLLPFLPLLLTQSSPMAGRVLYLAPLLLVTAVVAAEPWLARLLHRPQASVVLAAMLIALLLPTSTLSAADYPALYRADLQALAGVHARLRALQPEGDLTLVVGDPAAYAGDFDLYGIVRIQSGESKNSAFVYPWSSQPFVAWRAGMLQSSDPAAVGVCTATCAARAQDWQDREPFSLLPMGAERTFCLCP